ncbi:TetR/AcrR family transcriptional regulator [Spongiactinospora sp. 9N601]|uniref:TetR/AcrR family transcriptional regulator n=1 Tax=Spongiactinospora sp. 9N601 TaxID=3375149 RepID=UPI00378BD352
MAAPTESRRERVRQQTLAEIRATARRLLIERGQPAVTINAVAREMGMTGPALYHYFAGLEELVGAMTADFLRELAETMRAARDDHAAAGPARRLLAICRAMREWALAHRAEFGMVFASPLPPSNRPGTGSARFLAGQNFEQVFVDEIAELWEAAPFPVPDDLAPALRDQVAAYAAEAGWRLPPEVLHVMMSCWIRLYGLLCMEVLHQLDFVYTDLEPVYEECLRDLAERLGLPYEPPGIG